MPFDPVAYINGPRWQESRLGLGRIADLLDRMGRPQDRLRFVHVAGTNGKGSVCAYLARVLQEAGHRVGLFTSPFIFEFEERIRVDGRNITAEELLDVTRFVRGHAEAQAREAGEHATEFELMTAVAFEHFARRECDIVVCEVGLGGRLDSTNVIAAPEACVITRVGLDHTDLLGDTYEAIAREKAGIVKPGSMVVSWPQDDAAAMEAVREAARENGCPLSAPDFSQLEVMPVEGDHRPFRYRGRLYETALLGSYQPFNAALAIEVVEVLRNRRWNIPDEAVERGVAAARWPGRFEVVDPGPPPFVVDGGHNSQGARVLAESLRDVFPGRRVVFVMGVLADKDYPAMVGEVAPLTSAFVCAMPPNPRALDARELAAEVRRQVGSGVVVEAAEDYPAALRRARELADAQDVICMFGSLYAICELSSS